jgi:hypothetical protein
MSAMRGELRRTGYSSGLIDKGVAMTDQDRTQQQQPQGGTSVEEPQVPVPPYDDLRGSPSEEGKEAVRRAFDASNAPAPDPSVPVSDEERRGMSSAETDPEPPLGVGASRRSSGEDLAPERSDVGTKGASERPAGSSGGEDTGDEVNPNPSRTPGSPDLQTGDQGG